ncbi:hypothetical protein HYN69_00395 [Gemmobacter aquarius]|uniref:Uncharacterized protein n=1 Tax=Paragemmobacter aquarius TaxID=2169400 RepID=A0A2S0UH96_9RHOB|nr:hypothetical protein HYN69_00395 [Gemmobacter aquarius]
MRPASDIVVESSSPPFFAQTKKTLPLSKTVVTGGDSNQVVSLVWIGDAATTVDKPVAVGWKIEKIGSSSPASAELRT